MCKGVKYTSHRDSLESFKERIYNEYVARVLGTVCADIWRNHMKDTRHHLKHVQKKVIHSVRHEPAAPQVNNSPVSNVMMFESTSATGRIRSRYRKHAPGRAH